MSNISKHLYIIDASIFIFKYYFSMPSNWFAENGRPTETVYGYAAWLKSFLKKVGPSHVVGCFDESLGTCFRNDIYSDYKCSRVLPDDDLAFQLLACKKITEMMGVSTYGSECYEADDLVASFAAFCTEKSIPYTLLTRDKDLTQALYSENSSMWHFPTDDQQSKAQVESNMGIAADQVPSFLALVGDVADDIPGVPGIGKKTAIALLKNYGSWLEIKSHLGDIAELPLRGAKSIQEKLTQYKDQVDLAIQLTTLNTDAVKIKWKDTKRRPCDNKSLIELSKGLGFPRLFTSKS